MSAPSDCPSNCENIIEDVDTDIICRDCGEHASPSHCEDCEYDFGSNCCNAPARF